MRPDQPGDRRHSLADLLILLTAIVLTSATWACLPGTIGAAAWKCATNAAITLLLALATLTRNPDWAVATRTLTGIWLIASPALLRFQDFGLALWAYVGAGAVVTALIIPSLVARILAGRPSSCHAPATRWADRELYLAPPERDGAHPWHQPGIGTSATPANV